MLLSRLSRITLGFIIVISFLILMFFESIHFAYAQFPQIDLNVKDFYCEDGTMYVEYGVNVTSSSALSTIPPVIVNVVSPLGLSVYSPEIDWSLLSKKNTFWDLRKLSECVSGMYKVEFQYGANVIGGYSVWLDSMSFVEYEKDTDRILPVYIDKTVITSTNGYINFDVYYENNTSATVVLSRNDLDMGVLVYSNNYMMYNTFYDKEGKFVKYTVNYGKDIFIPPFSSKKIAIVGIPVFRMSKLYGKNEALLELHVFITLQSPLFKGGYLHALGFYQIDPCTSVPTWAQDFVEHFQSMAFIPWCDLEKEASRGDIALLFVIMDNDRSHFTTSTTFTDVSILSPYYTILHTLKNKHIVSGYPDGTYRPTRVLTRIEASIFLLKYLYGDTIYEMVKNYKVEGVFKDIPIDAWYAPWVEIAYKKGLVKGYADNTFRPFQGITRLELIVMTDRVHLFKLKKK